MGYASKHFAGRVDELGDAAEAAFERFATANSIAFDKKGFDRPKLPFFFKLPAIIRQIPDYVCYGQRHFFVECKGSGGRVLKFKPESIESLNFWNSHLDTWMFIYDSNQDRYLFMPFARLEQLALESPIKYFPSDNKPYHEIRVTKLDWQPVPKEEEDGNAFATGGAQLQEAGTDSRTNSERLRALVQRCRGPRSRLQPI
jgi:hypothetical protein